MEVVASLSQGRTAAAQCGLFTHKSVPVIFETPCSLSSFCSHARCPQSLQPMSFFTPAEGPEFGIQWLALLTRIPK